MLHDADATATVSFLSTVCVLRGDARQRKQMNTQVLSTRSGMQGAVAQRTRGVRPVSVVSGSPRCRAWHVLRAGLGSSSELASEPETELDASGLKRLAWSRGGGRWWLWRGHPIHYTVSGADKPGTPFLLVHGFGANSYHWRYNVPALADAGHPTYALCMLGYGKSAKPALEYTSELWGALVADFLREVVGRPALLAGNSIGAIAALGAAYDAPELTAGVALLNAAGRLDDLNSPAQSAPEAEDEDSAVMAALKAAFRRVVVSTIFLSTKFRIPQILSTVYVNKARVDAQLVDSIYQPACDADAPEAFFHISNAGKRSKRSLTVLLTAAKERGVPMTLVWGNKDPWMPPTKAASILAFYPAATFTGIDDAGHCPHDDSPVQANAALLEWAASLARV